jgi:CRISPR-associated protein Cst1
VTDAPALAVTSHPLQRAGAWAAAIMAGREQPAEMTADDLAAVAARLTSDVCDAATAPKDTAAYDWWKVLFALYPNSKATHSKRPSEQRALKPEIENLFAPDAAGAIVRPCTFCGADAGAVWAKSNLPLFDTSKALNTLPPGVRGWPVCHGCRIAMWALPYGAWVTAGSATVLSCENEAAEREFARRNVQRARRILHAGFNGLVAGARAELVAVTALRDAAAGLCATTLWSFKNDNQEPWLRVTRTRRAVSVFLATVDGNASLRRGWHLLRRALTRYDAIGAVTAGGAGEAARLLFEAEDGRSRSLLLQLHYLLKESEDSWRLADRDALTRLAFTYAEEVYGMTTDLEPVAVLLTEWIARGSSPRGRLAEYNNAALSDYHLGQLLLRASVRLQMDDTGTPMAGPEYWAPLIERRPRAWEQRLLLSARVLLLLQQRGVAVGAKAPDPEEERRIEAELDRPPFDDSHDDFAADDYSMGPA